MQKKNNERKKNTIRKNQSNYIKRNWSKQITTSLSSPVITTKKTASFSIILFDVVSTNEPQNELKSIYVHNYLLCAQTRRYISLRASRSK